MSMSAANTKRALIGGVFDYLHIGHVRLFKTAKEYCNYLVVVVASDAVAAKKRPIHNQDERAELVAAVRYVDEVIKGRPKPDWRIAEEADFIILGPDQPPVPLKKPIVRICEELAPHRSSQKKAQDFKIVRSY